MRPNVIRAALAAVALGIGIAHLTSAGCTSARFPYCEKDDDCKDKGDAKFCDNLRCVKCRYDDDCGDGKYCERKVAECKVLDRPGAAKDEPSAPPPPPEPEVTATTSATATASASAKAKATPPPKKK